MIGLLFLVFGCGFARAQAFTSGSTGADGALTLTTPGVVNFDPKSFNPPLDPEGDNVFNFTTITIASGVVLKLSGRTFSAPVYFLATGAIKIDGGIDLSGENGHPATNVASERTPAAPGPGGYAGGIGGRSSTTNPPTAGGGPGGGVAGTGGGAASGVFGGSTYMLPLVGGSGGGGYGVANGCGTTYGGGGGGGGGAIVIGSSTSIAFSRNVGSDAVVANGGTAGCGAGHGSGGSLRLVAPTISGNTEIQTNSPGPSGLIRFEANQNSFSCCPRGTFVFSIPFKIVTPVTQAQPNLQVTSINGVAINANPFSFPDTTINSSAPVVISVTAKSIPVGTVPKIIVYSEFGNDQTVDCTALQGTLQQSTCTASITFPTGGSRGFVKATW